MSSSMLERLKKASADYEVTTVPPCTLLAGHPVRRDTFTKQHLQCLSGSGTA